MTSNVRGSRFNYLSSRVQWSFLCVALGLAATSATVYAQSKPITSEIVPNIGRVLDDLYRKAQAAKETEVNHDGQPYVQSIGPVFEKRFPGIATKVRLVEAGTATTRVITEAGVGRSPDTFEGGMLFIKPLTDRDMFQKIAWPTEYGINSKYVGTGGTVQVSGFLSAHGFNSSKVKKEDLPKSLSDLLDPKWKGKIVTSDFPLTTHLSWQLLALNDVPWGTNFVKRLISEQGMVITSSEAATALLVQGEKPIMLFHPLYYFEKAKRLGAPVGEFYTEHMGAVSYQFGVLAKAKNPNAGRLFVLWLLSDEAQQAMWDCCALSSLVAPNSAQGGRVQSLGKAVEMETLENYQRRTVINTELRKSLGYIR
jgi:ABC-type Fe3+ transport system substrate-binding protein